MALDPYKGYRSLLRGRCSQSGSEYFLTFCTEHRLAGLTVESVASRILDEIRQMESDGIWASRCVVVMPDHVHLLVLLGNKLPLGKTVARLKSKSAVALKAAGIRWQDGYYEHRVRSQEERLSLFLYIYLNPYRAVLLPRDAAWP